MKIKEIIVIINDDVLYKEEPFLHFGNPTSVRVFKASSPFSSQSRNYCLLLELVKLKNTATACCAKYFVINADKIMRCKSVFLFKSWIFNYFYWYRHSTNFCVHGGGGVCPQSLSLRFTFVLVYLNKYRDIVDFMQYSEL